MMNKVTDARPPFFLVEDSVVTDYDLTPNEGWLYIVILKYANRKTGEAFPSVQTLAKEARISKATVLRTTKMLEAKGLIRVSREGNLTGRKRPVNHYWILQATRYLTDTDPGISQTPTPVSVGYQNQNHSEPEKDSASADTPQPDAVKPKAARPPNPMYDAIKDVWGYTAARNGQMAAVLHGTSTKKGYAEYNLEQPVTPDELRQWAAWYRRTALGGDEKMSMVEELIKVQSSITRWQELTADGGADGDDPFAGMFDTMEIIGGAPWEQQS